MAMTIPTAAELDEFSLGSLDAFSMEEKTTALQQASDLLWLATNVENDPSDARALRIVKYAQCEMAWALLVRSDNLTEIAGPYSSETIGSYSYSKAAAQVATGLPTGLGWFDLAVAMLMGATEDGGTMWSRTEWVFTQPFCPTPAASNWWGSGTWTGPDFYG